jgi:hypothetical protein
MSIRKVVEPGLEMAELDLILGLIDMAEQGVGSLDPLMDGLREKVEDIKHLRVGCARAMRGCCLTFAKYEVEDYG